MVLKFFFAFGQVDENGEIQQMEFKDYGVIVDGGKKVYVKGFNHYEMDKITDKEFEDIANDYDDIGAPPGPYTIQPDKKGMVNIQFLLGILYICKFIIMNRKDIVDIWSTWNGKVILCSNSWKKS